MGSASFAIAADKDPASSAWRIGVALGYGERSNPLIQSKPIPIAVDLDIAWFGKRFFFDNGDLGFTALNSAAGTLNLVARANSDRVFFGKTSVRFVSVSTTGAPLSVPTQLVVPDRNYAVELGVEYLADGKWGKMTLAGFHDVSHTHNGLAGEFEYAYPWYRGRWSVEPNVALRFKSSALNDYYWGVRVSEANAALPAYRAGSGINWRAGVRSSVYLTRSWRVAVGVDYERLSGAVADSPLTKVSDVLGWFAGVAYQF
jgi:outer membrane protein